MTMANPTLVGHIDSVKGGVLSIRLRDDMPTFTMIGGHSYRMGQVGAFLRIPLGYTQLYAVCTLVGAAAAPQLDLYDSPPGHRWLSATLFGESIGGVFERGVSQYPTIEDEVHVVSPKDMEVIYGSTKESRSIRIGHIAASSGISGELDLGSLITRHSAVVGSTGSGKSNLLAVLLEAISTQGFPSARALVIDPHGEYGSAVGQYGYVYKIRPNEGRGERPLHIPFWALPFDEFKDIALGEMQPGAEAAVRDEVTERKKRSATALRNPVPEGAITADSPVPFSARQLWFDLDDYERRTFQDGARIQPCELLEQGDPNLLTSNRYPPPHAGNQAPYAHPRPKNIGKQLELMKSRLQDARYSFLFRPGQHEPNLDGHIGSDLDSLVQSWVGHDRPITVLDVSGLPPDVLSTVVGTLIRIVYDFLYWSLDLPVSGRNQPLLLVLEEAHIFLPEGKETAAHRIIGRIAKEGRKYGCGLCVVTQRPGEIDSTVLSQCGTMIALRLSNNSDRSKVESAMPDDLGALTSMLPSLRTGEGIVLGDAMPIPSRIQFYRVRNRPMGDDPDMPNAWRKDRPPGEHYAVALNNWRHQSDTGDGEQNG